MIQPFTPAELDAIRDAAEAATKNATMYRYDHGGGRLAVFEGDKRELVADLYNLNDREFFDLIRPETVLRLAEQIERLTKELTDADCLRGNQLAAITSALMSDTRISHLNCQLPKGHALRTPAFDDAMRSIEKIFELRAALVEKARPIGWQPIETAPKDGTEIIASKNGKLFIVDWSPQNGWTTRNGNLINPDGWFPLPKPPEAK